MKRFFTIAALTALAACAETPAETEGPEAQASEAPQSLPSASSSKSEPEALAKASSPFCSPDETPIFSCKLENGKRVSVCGISEWLGRYSYGGDIPELELEGGAFANVMYSGGGESQIAFENGDYRYIVFSRMVRTNFEANEPNYPAFSQGLVVLNGEKLVDLHNCADRNDPDAGMNLSSANAIWESEEELFTAETIKANETILK